MTRHTLPTVGALVLALLVMLAGCASTPRAQWATQRDALSFLSESLVDAHKAGEITDEQFREGYEIVKSVRTYLKDARASLERGDDEQYERIMDHVRAGLKALREYNQLSADGGA